MPQPASNMDDLIEAQLGRLRSHTTSERIELLEYLVRSRLTWSREENIGQVAARLKKKVNTVVQTYHRLSKDLAEYYGTAGANDPFLFEVNRDFTVTIYPRYEFPEIPVRKFQEFLESHCDLAGMLHRDRDALVKEWWINSRFRDQERQLPANGAFEEFFNRRATKPAGLTLEEMHTLAETLHVHPIMLDPLRSERVDQDGVVVNLPTDNVEYLKQSKAQGFLHGFFATVPQKGRKGYGSDARYLIPSHQIADVDAAIVYLVLKPGAHSDDHHHPGDELMIVLKGSVHVHFLDSGLRIELNESSYMHFYAEQNHSAHNASHNDDAQLLIIRFDQLAKTLGKPPTRQQIRRKLWEAERNRGTQLDPVTWAWIIHAAANRSVNWVRREGSKTDVLGEVLNRFGLARLLTGLLKDGEGAHSLTEGPDLQDLWDWASGLAEVPSEQLLKSLNLYDVFPVLISGFLFPACTGQVLVRRQPESTDWIKLEEVAQKSTLKMQAVTAGVDYEIPKRSLACSDVAISWLRLLPNMATKDTSHPEWELVVPFKGSVEIKYKQSKKPVCTVSSSKTIAYFNSTNTHIIRNAGPDAAEMLLIRYYR